MGKMSAHEIAFKLLTSEEDKENGISNFILDERSYVLKKHLGNINYLKKFIDLEKGINSYKIPESITDEIKEIYISVLTLTKLEEFLYSIHSPSEDRINEGVYMLEIRCVSPKVSEELCKFGYSVKYNIYDISPETDKFINLYRNIFLQYCNLRKYDYSKIMQLDHKVVAEISNKNIDKMIDIEKQIEEICNIIEKIDS
jgi:hypothetical protein